MTIELFIYLCQIINTKPGNFARHTFLFYCVQNLLSLMNTCPICNAPKPKLKYKLKFNVYQCSHCHFQFCKDATFDKSTHSSLDEESRSKALKGLRNENFLKIIDSINKYKTSHFIGLEVGSGHGWFFEMCKNSDIECLGIEPETRFNEQYKKRGLHVINGFYPDVVQADTAYNFLAFNDVIEHLPAIESSMKANHSLLKPDGLLIVNLPIQSGLVYLFARIAYLFGIKSLLNRMWQFNFHSPHLSYFTKKNLINFAAANRFEMVESHPLKTINLSEISNRVNQDESSSSISRFITKIGILFSYPFFQLFPDTYYFVFRKE